MQAEAPQTNQGGRGPATADQAPVQGGPPDEGHGQDGDDRTEVTVTRAATAPPPPETTTDAANDRRFSLRETARILEVPEARLRALARAGLLAPQRGPIGPLSFGFQDLLLLRTTRALLESGVPMRRIRRVWASLRAQLDANIPLTSITVRLDGETVVATDGRTTWQPDSGQFVLDFDARALGALPPATPPPASSPVPPSYELPRLMPLAPAWREGARRAAPAVDTDDMTAEQWYDLALELETTAPAEALAAYQRVLEQSPDMADAHVNLGRLHHLAGERGLAEAHYRDAVRLAPEDPTPHFNLGVLLEEQGRRDEAAFAYAQAVARDPEFADAHCNLGLLLESLGRRQEAMRHLMSARELYRSSE